MRWNLNDAEGKALARRKEIAYQAIQAAQRYMAEGRRVVVDLELESLFDRVSHDLLIGSLAQRIDDRRVLQLIRRCLVSVPHEYSPVVPK